jgi:hypothetical protein
MTVRSCWSGASAEAPTVAVQLEAAQLEAVPPIAGARSLEGEQSFEGELS